MPEIGYTSPSALSDRNRHPTLRRKTRAGAALSHGVDKFPPLHVPDYAHHWTTQAGPSWWLQSSWLLSTAHTLQTCLTRKFSIGIFASEPIKILFHLASRSKWFIHKDRRGGFCFPFFFFFSHEPLYKVYACINTSLFLKQAKCS